MDFKIEIATKKDFNDINNLFIEMLETIYNKKVLSWYNENDLDRYFEKKDDIILLAKINNLTIGFLSIEVHKEDIKFLYLDDFSVSSMYRGNGIGFKLINRSFEYAKSLNIKRIRLHVEKENERSYNFYLKLGFKIIKNDDSRYLMEKEI